MKILITGGTGFVGKRLVKELLAEGHELVLMTRNPENSKRSGPYNRKTQFHRWNGLTEDFPADALVDVEGVINLMGENLAAKRWSNSQKEKLRNSRIKATKSLIEKVNQSSIKFFVSASAIGFYPVNQEFSLTESSTHGEGFLSELCQNWEGATEGLNPSIRKVILRLGVVLGKESGALAKLLPIFRLGLGGPVGAGKQMMSWIHIDDLVSVIVKSALDQEYSGIFNAVSPSPITNKEFSQALAKSISKPCLFPVPPIALKFVMGEMSSIILDGQNVLPEKLQEKGFKFKYPILQKALQHIVS